MGLVDKTLELLRKSITRKEKYFRENETPSGFSDELKEVCNRIEELLKESLELDYKDLRKFEDFKNEEMKEKYKTKKMKMNNLIGISGSIKAGKDLVGQMIQYLGDEVGEPTFDRFEYHINPNAYKVHRVQKYEIKKCADKLKDCICLLLGCTREQLEDREFKEAVLGEEWWCYDLPGTGLVPRWFWERESDNKISEERYMVKHTPRTLLQIFGTQGGRMVVHPNIWVNALFSDYKQTFKNMGQNFMETTSSFPNWIITDVRFPENEGLAVSSRDGLLIGIKRLFRLRFPEYEDLIDATMDGYATPKDLEEINPELYKNLHHESETSMGDHSWCDVIIENNGTVEELYDKVLEAVQTKKELV